MHTIVGGGPREAWYQETINDAMSTTGPLIGRQGEEVGLLASGRPGLRLSSTMAERDAKYRPGRFREQTPPGI